MKYEDLERLNRLRESGAITESEYQIEKEKILNRPEYAYSGSNSDFFGLEINNYCMLMHLSQLFPGLGWIAPIILWVINKDKNQDIDNHGKVIVNWILTSVIFYFIFALLCIVLIGIPLLILLTVLNIFFIIAGAINASNGLLWRYPLSITFIR